MMIQAITFDVTHTLIHCPRLGAIYSAVLGRHGIDVTAEEADRLVRLVWQELACAADPGHDRFTAHPDGARGFWQRFLERFSEHLEVPLSLRPSRFAAAELFHRFGSAEAWEVYPEVRGALRALKQEGLRLAVISNWDERLPGLLEELGLSPSFDAIVYSSEVGVEKPDRRIFAEALRRLDLPAAAALHVGDSPLEDVEGAIASGMEAVRLDRARRRGGIPDLSALLEGWKTPPSGRQARWRSF